MHPWYISFLQKIQSHANLYETYQRCTMNTRLTTVQYQDDNTTFIITGDIPAMWLRDSSMQVLPYLRFAKDDQMIQSMLKGLIKKQFTFILKDPYANAFMQKDDMVSEHHDDLTEMKRGVWERKYEVDSLCFPIWLFFQYIKATHDHSVIDELFWRVINCVIDVWEREQHHESSPYTFDRLNPYAPHDTLSFGKGTPVSYTGMTWSGFRPSDDACLYHFNIPANLFASHILNMVLELSKTFTQDDRLFSRIHTLNHEIQQGINTYGIIEHPTFGDVYAYEVDGLGHHVLMDDANIPSLLSLPFLGICEVDDRIYKNTRKMILSKANPFYVKGVYGQGIGSLHTPKNYVWPISICVEGLTSRHIHERFEKIKILLDTHADTHYMHESFDVDDPSQYTRSWFAWANSMFSLLVMSVEDDIDELIQYLNTR